MIQPNPGKVRFGAFSSLPGLTQEASLSQRENQLGRPLAIASHYYDWIDKFPGTAESTDVTKGRIPMVSWWGTNLNSINNGSQDSLIRARAADVKAFGSRVFIRWAAEMNGDWFAWSGPQNGNDPAAFVSAWRRVHDIFAAAGVTNVTWVWAPNADSHPGLTDRTSWNNWRNYYPGDLYVDWVGIDGYNWGATGGNVWQSLGSVMEPIYDDYASRKPIMIAETSSVEGSGGKAAWVDDAASWIKAHPAIGAVVWFDTNRSSTGIDWRIDSSPSALAAFTAMAKDPAFQG